MADKIAVKDGWPICPTCRRPIHGLKILPETTGTDLAVRCRVCRKEIVLNIDSGQRVYCQRP